MSTQQYRAQASWKQRKTSRYTYPKFVYQIPIMFGGRMVESLGAIEKRTDGRWDWWRFKSEYHKRWIEGQGVAVNQEAAKMRVLGGWEHYEVSNM